MPDVDDQSEFYNIIFDVFVKKESYELYLNRL